MYSFNTLIIPERYCNLVSLSVQSRHQRDKQAGRKRQSMSGLNYSEVNEVIRQKKTRVARRIRRTDQWELMRKGLFRYKDTARQADLQATRG